MALYKNALLRITGLPFNILELSKNSLKSICEEIITIENRITELQEILLQDLHTYNQSLDDEKLQREIQNYRRNLYNKKKAKYNKEFINTMPKRLSSQINQLERINNHKEILFLRLAEEHNTTLSSERSGIKSGSSNHSFINGLYMASQSLMEATIKYQKTNLPLNKKELQTEKSILKYLSRTAAKTSPFSTLTSIAIVPISAGLQKEMLFVSQKKPKTKSSFRINNIIQHKFRELLLHNTDTIKHFHLKLNPSLKVKKKHFKFLINQMNQERFQSIERTEFLNYLVDLFKTQTNIKFKTIQQKLEKKVDASPEQLEQILISCIHSGIFEIEFGFSGIDPNWVNAMINKLTKKFTNKSMEHIDSMISTLSLLRDTTQKYEVADFEYKGKLLNTAYTAIENTFSLFQDETIQTDDSLNKIKAEKIFFEDSRNNLKIKLNRDRLSKHLSNLHRFSQLIDFFDAKNSERMTMFEYFKRKYKSKKHISLLTFYKDYYSEVKLLDAQQSTENKIKAETSTTPIKETPYLTSLTTWKSAFLNGLDFQNKDLIVIDTTDLERANDSINYQPNLQKTRSIATFSHLSADAEITENEYLVVNSLFSGYGKMFSRFLHLFPKATAIHLKENNVKHQPEDAIFAELQDSSYHNANLHPMLLDYEIRIPGGHQSLTHKKQISVSDLDLKIDELTNTLNLIQRQTGKIVYPFDLGFQGGPGRSELFKLLNRFTYADLNSHIPIVEMINKRIFTTAKNKGVIQFPNIVWIKNIYLQRRTWLVAKSLIPLKGQKDDISYFKDVITWKKQIGLPDKVFIRLVVKAIIMKFEYSKKMGFDDYKPQFIDFNSPMFHKLFEQLANKSGDYIQIEEMLPDENTLININGDKYVTEFYIQYDK